MKIARLQTRFDLMTMIGDDEEDDLVIMMAMVAMVMLIMKISRSLLLPML